MNYKMKAKKHFKEFWKIKVDGIMVGKIDTWWSEDAQSSLVMIFETEIISSLQI